MLKYLEGIPVKIVIMLTQVPLIVVQVIVSVITCCSSRVVRVNALLSAHAMQEEKRRYGLSQSSVILYYGTNPATMKTVL